jgi:hypothetical protein
VNHSEIGKTESVAMGEDQPSRPEKAGLIQVLTAEALYLLWGVAILLAPVYLRVAGTWRIPFYLCGAIVCNIALGLPLFKSHKLAPTVFSREDADGMLTIFCVWYWGIVLLFAPHYVGLSLAWSFISNLFGMVAVIISFVGALIELRKREEGYTRFLAFPGFFLLALAILVHIAVGQSRPSQPWETLGRVVTFVLSFVGATLLVPILPFSSLTSSADAARSANERSREGKGEPDGPQDMPVADIKHFVFRALAFLCLATLVVLVFVVTWE